MMRIEFSFMPAGGSGVRWAGTRPLGTPRCCTSQIDDASLPQEFNAILKEVEMLVALG